MNHEDVGGLTKEEEPLADEALKPFISNICPNCGSQLDGIFGRFLFGLESGEGYCSQCRWPCRAHHKIGDKTLVAVLAYSPEYLGCQ